MYAWVARGSLVIFEAPKFTKNQLLLGAPLQTQLEELGTLPQTP